LDDDVLFANATHSASPWPAALLRREADGLAVSPIIDVKVPTCSGATLTPLGYKNAVAAVWFQLANPQGTAASPLDPTMHPWGNQQPGSYGREHIYELQLRECQQSCGSASAKAHADAQ
jgi:hypothetical protein